MLFWDSVALADGLLVVVEEGVDAGEAGAVLDDVGSAMAVTPPRHRASIATMLAKVPTAVAREVQAQDDCGLRFTVPPHSLRARAISAVSGLGDRRS